ncbi:MAG: alpha-amylase/4-alpha-glucanotransferase domain-containing protein [Elusimicrobiota bacterium]
MKKINFIFGVHNHQPIGNFDNVFEHAVKQAYQPFLDVIEKHPTIKIVFHYTGCLIDWLEEHKPEILVRLQKLIENKQAEILTGGYYEPILPVIPDRDKLGQIAKLTDYIKNKFAFTPKGLWLAERVWEPSLAKILNEAGVEFVVLDDAHFLASGIDEKKLRGYFVTEEQGVQLKIFPINQKLRYLTPFALPEESIKYLQNEITDDPSTLLVMADDGEKFGLWPDTYKTCYEKKWLEKFFTMLEQNADWLTTTTFSEYLNQFPAADRIYLPTASYFEMSEWSLPAKSQVDFQALAKNADNNLKRFLKGGIWRNFLTKYPESNNMHKKMLYVSEKIRQISRIADKQVSNKNSSSLNRSTAQPLNHLYKAQCNCAYWHGIFGGLYLPHLRYAVYKNLIEAEQKSEVRSQKSEVEIVDFDKDSYDEIIMSSKNFNIYVKPSYGGAVFELDFKPLHNSPINLTNILTRRYEAYHKKIDLAVVKKVEEVGDSETDAIPLPDMVFAKEEGLKNYLKYDWYNRYSLLDHFLHPDTTLEAFSKCEYGEQGDFIIEPYKFELKKKGGVAVILERNGSVWCNNKKYPVRVVKTIKPSIKNTISVDYKIKNLADESISLWFGSEFNISFSEPEVENLVSPSTPSPPSKKFVVKDNGYNFMLLFEFSDECEIWSFPVYTVSLSEAGFEKMYQQTAIFPNWKFTLLPKTTLQTSFKLTVSNFNL